MSELSAAVAAAIGIPEELVIRSASARAQASGVSTDDVLAAWSGGGAVPAAAPASVPADAPAVETPATEAPPAAPEATEQPAAAPAAAQAPPTGGAPSTGPVIVAARRDAAPLVVGRKESHVTMLLGLVGVFLLGVLVAVVVPALDARQIAADQIAGSTPALSDLATDGRGIYVREGCQQCHTQQVRSVVTDVGLGKVTEPGTRPNSMVDTSGTVRIGPDLTHVGSREPTNDPGWLTTFLRSPETVHPESLQPSYAYLSDAEMSALVQFLIESK